ncbi:MAG: YfhO family protein [Deltaproteobacteria bacterium]|nr:YfhO family protein [Deltaproteobacteria bacterium]
MTVRARAAAWCHRHPVAVDVSALALAMLCLFPQSLTAENVFFTEDHLAAFSAWREAVDAIRRGELPLWSEWLFSGFPFSADAQTEVFYPPAVFFRQLLPPVLGYNLYIPFTLFLAATNQYVLCRVCGTSRLAAVVGGIIFGGGFPVANQSASFACIATIAWLPGILAAALHLIESPGLRRATLLAALLGIQVLAGYFQFVAMTVVLCALLFVLNRPTWRGLFWFATAGVWALALSAVVLIPSVELLSLSTRAQAGNFPYATSVHPIQWLALFSPDHFGNPAEDTFWIAFDPFRFFVSTPYFGIAAPILAVFFVATLGDRRDIAILAGLVLCAVLAMGPHTPLHKILAEIPLFSKFRAPSRWLQPLAAFFALAAAIGLDRIRSRPSRSLLVAGGSFLFTALLLSAWAKGFPVPSLGPADVPAVQHERVVAISHPRDLFFAIAFGIATIVTLWAVRRDWRFAAGLVPLLIADLAVHSTFLRPVAPVSILDRPDNLKSLVPFDGRIFRDPTFHDPLHYAPEQARAGASRAGWAFGVAPYLRAGETWGPGAGILFQVEAVDGISAFCFDRYRRLLGGKDFGSVPVFRPTPEVLDLLGVRYQAFPVVARPTALPRAFFVESAQVADDDAVEKAIQGRGVDFRKLAFVAEGETSHDARCRAATVVRTGAFSYTTRTDARCLLVVADPHHPGWRAWLDGSETPLLRANLALRAVWIPAGEHRVEFDFHPMTLRIGLLLSAIAWILTFLGAKWPSRRSTKPRPLEESTDPRAHKWFRRARWIWVVFVVIVCAAGAVLEPKLWKKNVDWLHYPSAAKRIAVMFSIGLLREGDARNAERHRDAALRMP